MTKQEPSGAGGVIGDDTKQIRLAPIASIRPFTRQTLTTHNIHLRWPHGGQLNHELLFLVSPPVAVDKEDGE